MCHSKFVECLDLIMSIPRCNRVTVSPVKEENVCPFHQGMGFSKILEAFPGATRHQISGRSGVSAHGRISSAVWGSKFRILGKDEGSKSRINWFRKQT
jgi:hypothetical protein